MISAVQVAPAVAMSRTNTKAAAKPVDALPKEWQFHAAASPVALELKRRDAKPSISHLRRDSNLIAKELRNSRILHGKLWPVVSLGDYIHRQDVDLLIASYHA